MSLIYTHNVSEIIFSEKLDENANLQQNPETIHKAIADHVLREYALHVLPQDVADEHIRGGLHIHDLEYFITRPFCQDHDLRYFFYYGLLPDGTGQKASVAGPAKRPEVAILHAVKALGSAQTNFAGGQGFYNFLTFIAPYLEDLEYEEIDHLMQMFLYEMNQMMVARGGQLVFSSVQLTPGVPSLWWDKPVVYRGHIWDGEDMPLRTYGEFDYCIRLAFQALMNQYAEGDYRGRPYSFPKAEILIHSDFIKSEPPQDCDEPLILTYSGLYKLAFTVAAKNGSVYFDNALPAYKSPPGVNTVSCVQCCSYSFSSQAHRDQKIEEKLYFRGAEHFSMGAGQVVTLNLPRVALKAAYYENMEDRMKFFDTEIDRLLALCVKIFCEKQKYIRKMASEGKLPFCTQRPRPGAPPLVDLDALSYIVGIVGLSETIDILREKQYSILEEDGIALGESIVANLGIKVMKLSDEVGLNIQVARTPAETVAGRFACLDFQEFRKSREYICGDIQTAEMLVKQGYRGMLPVYYTNGTHVPAHLNVSLGKKIEIESKFFSLLPGGNIFHIFLGEKDPDPGAVAKIGWKIARNTDIGYFAFTKDFTQCLDCGHIEAGVESRCTRCGGTRVDYISRITGYVQPVSGWNAAKRQEFKDRNRYKIFGSQ